LLKLVDPDNFLEIAWRWDVQVAQLRLLGDHHHSTRIAFVEFIMAESAVAALNCSGAVLGSLPIR
jgi:hypothetical protein